MNDKSVNRAFFEKIAEIMPGDCVITEVDPVEEDGVEGEWIQFAYGGAKIRAEVKEDNLTINIVQMPLKVSFNILPETMTLVKIPMADPELFNRIPLVLGGFLNRSIDGDIEKCEKELERLKKMRAIEGMKDKLSAYLGGVE